MKNRNKAVILDRYRQQHNSIFNSADYQVERTNDGNYEQSDIISVEKEQFNISL
jgi:hypothetical protein